MSSSSDDLSINIPINGDTSGIENAMGSMKGKLSSALSGVRDVMGGLGLASAGFLKGAIDEAADAQKNMADLEQTIKSTGGAAGLSAGQIADMAAELQSKTTFEGDEVLKGQNMLLTFTNIQKEVFKDASTAMMDLSQKMGTGPSQTAIQLGKALNDPINGVSALTRVGITFTDQQKNQIKTMQESGNMAGAQRIILNELNKEFGGQAAAAANTYDGKLKQLGNSFKDIKENIGTQLLPYLTHLATKVQSITKDVSDFMSKHSELVAKILSATAVFGTLIGGLGLLQKVMGVLGPTISTIGALIGSLTWPLLVVIAAVALLTAAFVKDWGGIRTKTEEFIAYMKPILIDTFNAVVEWFKLNWPTIKATTLEVFEGIKTVYNTVLKPVLDFMLQVFGQIVGWVIENWPLIHQTIDTVVHNIQTVIMVVLEAIQKFWNTWGETIMDYVSIVWNNIKIVITTTIHIVEGVIKLVMNLINGNWKAAWGDLVQIVKDIFGGVGAVIKNILGGIATIFADIAHVAVEWGANMINGFIKGITSKTNAVKDAVGGVIKGVKGFLGFNSPSEEGEGRHIVEWGENMIGGFMGGIKNKLPDMQRLMSTVINAPDLKTNVNMGVNGSAVSAGGLSAQYVTNNFNGNYSFADKNDIDYFMNKASQLIQRRRG